MRHQFEEWYMRQFPKAFVGMLVYTDADGYAEQLVQAMWIGYSAGVLSVR